MSNITLSGAAVSHFTHSQAMYHCYAVDVRRDHVDFSVLSYTFSRFPILADVICRTPPFPREFYSNTDYSLRSCWLPHLLSGYSYFAC